MKRRNIELADRMSTALIRALEALSPTERAVFVLRDPFDLGYDEIAAAVGETTAEVRRIAHRARRHIAVHRPTQLPTPQPHQNPWGTSEM